LELATRSAERLRESIAAEPFALAEGVVPVTLTLGVAASNQAPGTRTPALLIRAADAALYRGKKGGRNRVEVATAEDVATAERHDGNHEVTARGEAEGPAR